MERERERNGGCDGERKGGREEEGKRDDQANEREQEIVTSHLRQDCIHSLSKYLHEPQSSPYLVQNKKQKPHLLTVTVNNLNSQFINEHLPGRVRPKERKRVQSQTKRFWSFHG